MGSNVPQLRVRLFGELRVIVDNVPNLELGSARDQALFAYLILHPGDRHSRSRLAFLFWPDSTEEGARNRLRHALYLFRRALPEPSPDLPWLLTDRDTVAWNPSAPAEIDVVTFRLALDPPRQLTEVEHALSLYQGDLLENFYDDIFRGERDRLRDLRFRGYEWLIATAEQGGEIGKATLVAQRLVAADPLREESHRRLLGLLSRSGDRAGALRHYEQLRDLLRRELDVEPAEETIALVAGLRGPGSRRAVTPTLFAVGERELDTSIQSAAVSLPPSVSQQSPVTQQPSGFGPPLTRPLARPTTPLVGVAPLVGRDEELAYLRRRWEQAAAGRGSLVLVSGEAGMGKTRLVAELVETIAGDAIVLTGRARETEQLIPYVPIVEAFRGLFANPNAEALVAEIDSVWLAELARLLPEIRGQWPGLPQPETLDPSRERLRLFEGLARCLGVVARRPVLLILDDLHWADEASLAWLEYVSRSLADRHLLIVGTTRTEEVSNPLTEMRARLIRDGWDADLPIGRLANDDLLHLVRELSGSPTGLGELNAQIYEETGGNPLFILETLRALIETGQVTLEEGGWRASRLAPAGRRLPLPRTVREVIGARLGRLPDRARQVAGAAAVIGREFDVELLMTVAGQAEDDVLDALDDLLRAHVIDEVTGLTATALPGIRYAFSHDKVHEVVYADLSGARRARLHARAAEALLARSGDQPALIAGQLGRHYRQAQVVVEAAKYHAIAAESATRTYAYREACSSYLEALECLNIVTADAEIRRRRIGLRLQLAQVAFYVEPGRLESWLAPAETDARALGDPGLEVAVSMAQAGALYIQGQFTAAEVRLTPILELADRTGNRALGVRARSLLGRMQVLRGDSLPGRETLLTMLASAEGVLNEADTLVSQAMAAAALSVVGRFDEAIRDAELVLARSFERRDPASIAITLVFLEAIHQHRGEWRRAAQLGQDAIVRSREATNRIYEYNAHLFLGLALSNLGDPAGAIAVQEAAVRLAEESSVQLLLGRTYAWLAEVRLRAGLIADARAAGLTGRALAEQQGNAFEVAINDRLLGEIALAAGEHAAAARHLSLAEVAFSAIGAKPELARTYFAQSRLALEVDDGAAEQLKGQADRMFAEMGIPRPLGEA